ncbi:UDP-galactose 4-epimerase [Methylobacillus rhizosphaerae]|uniref:UDP-glucose 4-epimerase n=1 Tax=Methylobacillus rhizosphaerae TaxID=551994 RepID=A0A239AZA1_9PROT|nr:UDP-glucose 4-epimerase GalE [Methylobacillus rhizosphaerae]SNS00937.1 UDP-galactose 4-epimerase [Methylobacillus rhizosphaerae]
MILVTGGTGYIGSHACVELINAGYDVVVLDNFSNSQSHMIDRIGKITGKAPVLVEGDVRDEALLQDLFSKHQFDAVMHFAGLKAVGESVAQPLRYYDNNVAGSVTLLRVMQQFHVKKFVFSSSATVYGDPASVPIREHFPLSATNPYGASKLMVEDILRDLSKSDPTWRIAILRYFNPVGAHESGLIGENPNGIPNNLMPYITQVAQGQREQLSIFGSDYPTPDGTGVRDYIHVVDLVVGHLRALEKLEQAEGMLTCNLGTGQGYSVLQMVQAFEQASGQSVPYQLVARRPGDVAASYTDPAYAEQTLNWKATRGLEQMCIDSWRWQRSLVSDV